MPSKKNVKNKNRLKSSRNRKRNYKSKSGCKSSFFNWGGQGNVGGSVTANVVDTLKNTTNAVTDVVKNATNQTTDTFSRLSNDATSVATDTTNDIIGTSNKIYDKSKILNEVFHQNYYFFYFLIKFNFQIQ